MKINEDMEDVALNEYVKWSSFRLETQLLAAGKH